MFACVLSSPSAAAAAAAAEGGRRGARRHPSSFAAAILRALASPATLANELALTRAAAAIHPKCIASGKWHRQYAPRGIALGGERAARDDAPPSAPASAKSNAAEIQNRLGARNAGRKAAHHSDWRPHASAHHGATAA